MMNPIQEDNQFNVDKIIQDQGGKEDEHDEQQDGIRHRQCSLPSHKSHNLPKLVESGITDDYFTLLAREQVEVVFREPFIHSHYRRPGHCSFHHCFRHDLFRRHNELINIWTHLIPTLYFAGLLILRLWSPHWYLSTNGLPLLMFLIMTIMLPLLSSLAHLLNTFSLRLRHVAFFGDYLGISLYSFAGAVAYHSYSFPKHCNSIYEQAYLPVALILSAASHVMACYTRVAKKPHKLFLHSGRFFAYFVPYVFVTSPVAIRVLEWLFFDESSNEVEAANFMHALHFICAICATFFYLSRLPERIWPGKFDFLGHSHQIFHLFTVAATYFQLAGLEIDIESAAAAAIHRHSEIAGATTTTMIEYNNQHQLQGDSSVVVGSGLSDSEMSEHYEPSKLILWWCALALHDVAVCALIGISLPTNETSNNTGGNISKHHKTSDGSSSKNNNINGGVSKYLPSIAQVISIWRTIRLAVVGSFRHRRRLFH